jgi:hypothetical protein
VGSQPHEGRRHRVDHSGRVIRLHLDDEQKYALRDRDGQLALDLLRHALAARVTSVELRCGVKRAYWLLRRPRRLA